MPARPDEPAVDDEMEDVHMIDYEDTPGHGGGGRGEAYDNQSDDEDGPGHGQRVGCQQQ